MFGYIRFSKGELKINEYETYRAVYCSLCKYLGKHYGILSRFTLSYDFTFLSLLNLGMADVCPEYKKGRCTFNPLKKCNYCKTADDLAFPAAAATISFYYKLADNVADSKGIKKAAFGFLKLLFKGKHKKAAAKYPEIEKIISEYIKEQAAFEKGNSGSLDGAAHPTAKALGEVLSYSGKTEPQKRALERMGYCLGRYIYLLDAACDIEKDIKSGNFNVLKADCNTKEQAANKIIPQLYFSVNEACKAFELIDLKRYRTIMGNVLYLGLEETFLKELKDEKSV